MVVITARYHNGLGECCTSRWKAGLPESTQEQAKPVFDELEVWLQAQLPRISGKSELAKAIRYALTRMSKMRDYLNHGGLELDNNTAERSMRCVALRRKNYLFVCIGCR